jgi:site-specific recombinase XerD
LRSKTPRPQTEESCVHWLIRYATFLKDQKPNPTSTTEQKIEDFLTNLALSGMSASSQNQAFNGLLFLYRHALKQPLGSINALRARRPAALRHCPARDEVVQLLAHISEIHRYSRSFALVRG